MKINWQKTASVGICLTIALFFVFLLGKYLFAAFLPFIIAWALALITNLIAQKIGNRLKLPRKLCAAIILLLLFLGIGTLLFLGINRFLSEIENILYGISSEKSGLAQSISSFVSKLGNISAHLPFFKDITEGSGLAIIGEQIDDMAIEIIKEMASNMVNWITNFASNVIKALPSIILFTVITVIASFYFAVDFVSINEWISASLPPRISQKLPKLKAHTKSLAVRYLKAYSLLMLLTFFEVFIGLSIIRVDYAFLLALGISFLDILPIFGVGTVLIPWSIFAFITHDFGTGMGLLVLWAAITVIRQVTEPKILGESIGLHPIVTLMGMFVGFRLFGILGMLLAPAAIIAVKSYVGESQKGDEKAIKKA